MVLCEQFMYVMFQGASVLQRVSVIRFFSLLSNILLRGCTASYLLIQQFLDI
jgi:hypothetical protein